MNDLVTCIIAMGTGMILGYLGIALCFVNDLFTHKCSSCGTRVIDHVNGVKITDKEGHAIRLCLDCYEQENEELKGQLVKKYAVEVNNAKA